MAKNQLVIMKKSLLFTVILLMNSSLIVFGSESDIIVNLFTTNDLHGVIVEQTANFMNPEYPPKILGGSAMVKYLDDLRVQVEDSDEGLLVLDGGNFFQGHPLGLSDGGHTMIEWMNRMGYDAIVPGRYDFILGSENLNSLAQSANFPFLASNLECKGCLLSSRSFKPYVIREIKGMKLGILGIVDSGLKDKVLSENIPGLEPMTEALAMRKYIPELKSLGADVIIILTSSGVPWDRDVVYQDFRDSLMTGWNAENSNLNSIQMGYYAHGADIIVSGGESKGYPLPWYDPNSHAYIFQNYGNGTEFGHIRLRIDSKTHLFTGYETVVDGRVSQTLLADDFAMDGQMHKWIQKKEKSAIEQIYNQNSSDTQYQQTKCNTTKPNFSRNDWNIPSINQDGRFEVVTWNCEFFPTNGMQTIEALSEAVNDLDADIIAFQEIKQRGWFSQLMNQIPQYDYVISHQSSFMDQAIIYKKNMFQLTRQVEPFAENDYNYAGRPPLRADFQYICELDTLDFSIINLHMKCCDSGLKRRQKAIQMLYDYLIKDINNGYENIIVVGDWNDDLKDEDNAHGFHPFFEDNRFYFANDKIVWDDNQASYPKEPYFSFLDHILVSESFIPRSDDVIIQTIPMDDYMGNFDVYEEYISDHLPVMMGFSIPFKK